MKTLKPILILIALAGVLYLSFFIFKINQKKQTIKEDVIELSNIKYGLFNVDEWKKIMTSIIAKKIEEFELKGSNRKELKKKISDFLYKVIEEFEQKTIEQNSGSIGGFFKNKITGFVDIFGKLKQNVPTFTNQILDFLNDANNKKALKNYLSAKLNEYADNTFSKLDYTNHNSILTKHNFSERAAALIYLNGQLNLLTQQAENFKVQLMILAAVVALMIVIFKNISRLEFLLLSLVCLAFLVIGLSLPMIEIDARVSEIKVNLLGQQINFQDQVLYYKSKSILQVVSLMLTQGGYDLLAVGFLVLTFSVLFPFTKLVSSVCLVYFPNLQNNKIIHFLVHKTGKWSMADVMVVAIFMSYLGFSGILTEQLQQLEHLSPGIDLLSTNQSSLQTGFFAFTAFAFLSLLSTNKLKKNFGVNP
jgi:hypothetical protein